MTKNKDDKNQQITPAPIAAPAAVQNIAATPAPIMTLVDDGSRTFLDVRMFDYLGYVYALVLRGSPYTSIQVGAPAQLEIYAFDRMIDRDRFYGMLKQLMAYQHADPNTKVFVDMYRNTIDSFRHRMNAIEKEH